MTRTHNTATRMRHHHHNNNSKQQQLQAPLIRPPCRMWRSRKLVASLALGTSLAVLLLLTVGPVHRQQSFSCVEGAKSLKALAKTFVYQQLTMRKNFLPLPVPIPVPIEINEPPVYLKGKPKYVNVYRPKPTAAPVVAKPTTVYHMPIYSPTYEYMSVDPMSSMYGHVSPVVYPTGPYGKATGGHKSSASSYHQHQQQHLMDGGGGGDQADVYASYPSSSSGSSSSVNFNDYDDETGAYYMGRAGRRRSKLMSATAGDYISGASLDLHHRIDEDYNSPDSHHADDLATSSSTSTSSASSSKTQQQQQQQSPPNSETNASLSAPPTASQVESEDSEEGDDEDQHDESNESAASPEDEESYDNEDDSKTGALKRSKRQVFYQSGYDGKENCEGFPLEINVRSRIKMDQVFPIFGKSQMRKCVKPKKPFHILPPPPPEEHY